MKNISLGVGRLNWPKVGDEPFVASNNPRHEARLDMTPRTFCIYALAYKEAGDRVIGCAIKRRTRYPDYDIFPVGFLYSHYLELTLKEIICRGRRCTLKSAGISDTHSLSRLWIEARSVLEDLSSGQYCDELAVVGRCIERFHEFDEFSQGFRYPLDSKGRKTLLLFSRVDLRNLRTVMTRVAGFLDSAIDYISEGNRNSE